MVESGLELLCFRFMLLCPNLCIMSFLVKVGKKCKRYNKIILFLQFDIFRFNARTN